MYKHWLYLKYLLRHKYFVFLAGLATGAPLWRLLVHDWSKFLPAEWFPYVEYFYGSKYEDSKTYNDIADAKQVRQEAFDRAWLHHQRMNPHHWQYWVLMDDNPKHSRFVIQSYGDDQDCFFRRWDEATSAPVDKVQLFLGDTSALAENPQRYALAFELCNAANRYRPLPMPDEFIAEMLADWMGAGRAIRGYWDVWKWYEQNKAVIVLHPETRKKVEARLLELQRLYKELSTI